MIFSEEIMIISMLLTMFLFLLTGYQVAFTIAGVPLLFALFGKLIGIFDMSYVAALPNRIYGIMTNDLLISVPLFVFMGVMLQKSKIAEELLESKAVLMSNVRSGLTKSVTLVGALLAASTGIVGATVVTMGLLSLPTMLKKGYSPSLSAGTICAAGTLGQIIPPSIVLILLSDQISASYQQAQLELGNFSPESVSVTDLFVGALIPGICLVFLYILWQLINSYLNPKSIPIKKKVIKKGEVFTIYKKVFKALLPPLILIIAVLGSILGGLATPTESAGVGAIGAILLAYLKKQLNFNVMKEVLQSTAKTTSMVFIILVGAALFSLVFRGYGGDEIVAHFLTNLSGGVVISVIITMVAIFLLGFFLEVFEIIYVVVPIIGPAILMLGVDPLWFAIMIAINLQTSFLTPPFGFALFYLRGVAPKHVLTTQIYKGAIPFVFIQLLMLIILWFYPELATFLPKVIYN